MRVTEKVRKEIPNVLDEAGVELSEAELLEKLAIKIPELIKDDGDLRPGVLRGVLNKLDRIPVKGLKIERRGGSVYYYTEESEESEESKESKGWNQLVEEFVRELENREILKLDFTKDVSEKEIEFVKKASKVINEIKNIQEVE